MPVPRRIEPRPALPEIEQQGHQGLADEDVDRAVAAGGAGAAGRGVVLGIVSGAGANLTDRQ